MSHLKPNQSGLLSNIIFEDEAFAVSRLHKVLNECTKNPAHTHFFPIKAFKMQHLPVGYRDTDLLQLVQAIASLTVRIATQMVSANRPEFLPNSKIPYPFYKSKNKTVLRIGSGIIHEVIKYANETNSKNKNSLNDKICPCSKCKDSEKPSDVWAEITILTTAHVVFDDIEAKHSSARFFFDDDHSPKVVLETSHVEDSDVEKDFCFLVFVTCDISLIDNIEKTLKVFENLRFKVDSRYKNRRDVDKCAFIVSHPHGFSKQISFGQWVEKINVGDDGQWSKFTYTTATCPGSAGAHVHIVGYSGRVWHYPLLHSGSIDFNKNCSNMGFVD